MDDFDAAEVANGIHELYEPLAEEDGMTLRVKATSTRLHGNRELISQALANLVENAIKYGKPAPSAQPLSAGAAQVIIDRAKVKYGYHGAAAEALARDIRYNMCRERWDVVQQALQVYNLAKGFTRNERAGALVAHVRTMQSALGRSGIRRKAKTTQSPVPDSQPH